MRGRGQGRAWGLALLLLLSGCGEAAFSAHARDNDVGDLQRAMSVSAAPAAVAAHPMAFLVSDRKLVGFDLAAGKIAWQQNADVRSRVIVGVGAIAHRQGEHDLVVRTSATGEVRVTVTLPADESFVGATLDGDRLVYVTQTADKRSLVTALDAAGRTLWRRATPNAVGSPAARGGLVALPFAHQNLALLDGTSGRELARVRDTDEEIAYARALPEGIYYGGARGIYRLDDKSAAGSRAGSSYAEAKLPGEQVRTAYHWDGYEPAQSAIGAFDRNRLLWRGRDAGAGFRDDLAVLHSYRFFFAFDARAGKLRWVYAHPRTDVVASEDAGSAIVFASADGDVGLIDPVSGAVRVVQRTGLRVAGASFDADGITAGAGAQPPTEEEVAQTLEQIVWDHDARFGAVKVFAVDALGGVPGLPVSRALIKIVRAAPGPGGPPPAAQQHAGEALVARKDVKAVPLMLEALAEHYDFLDDKQPRGVGVLARALAAVDAKEAAPLLAAHLADHETPERAAQGHRTDAGAPRRPRRRACAARVPAGVPRRSDVPARSGAAVHRRRGAHQLSAVEARRAVAFVVEDPRTLQPVARELRVALDAATAKEKQSAQDKDKPEGAQAAPEKQE